MPGIVGEFPEIFQWIAERSTEGTFVNMMAQYRPFGLIVGWLSRAEQSCGNAQFWKVGLRQC